MTEAFIFTRPMYRVFVFVDGDEVNLHIELTAKGKQYARGRARGFHRRVENDEDALAEIIHARDSYYPAARRPDSIFEAKF
jgi:hypothetical protein